MFSDHQLTYCDQQAILYCKLHFKTTNTIEDLKVFVGKQYALGHDQIDMHSIYHFVVKLYFKLIAKGLINVNYEDFVLELFKHRKNIDHLGLIHTLKALIQDVNVSGLNLGEPDYSLLPKII
jgi:hypothetical protein